MIPKESVLRVVRPTDKLKEITLMYSKALGFEVLAQSADADRFDCMVLGHPKHAYHLEFSCLRDSETAQVAAHNPMLIFFLPCSREWERACRSMIDAGFVVVEPASSYWEQVGKTFEDIEGYRVVLQNRDWAA